MSSEYPRASSGRNVKKDEVLIVHIPVDAADKTFLTRLFKQLMNADVDFVPKETYDRWQLQVAAFAGHTAASSETRYKPESNFSFASITSPEQYLFREHFIDFWARHPHLEVAATQRFVGATFNYLADHNGARFTFVPDGKGGRKLREPQPLGGIVVQSRESLGIEAYQGKMDEYTKNGVTINYGILAGSIVETAASLESANYLKLSSAEQAHLVIAAHLKNQFSS